MGKHTATVRRLIMAIRFVRDLLKPIPIVVLVATVGIAGNLAPAHAERVCVVIIAEVVTVIDLGNYLGGAISEGDVITGTYNYETTTQDTNPLPTVGDYWHTDVPFGITLNAGGFLFRTNPNNVNFLIEIVNDHGTPTSDNYLLRSYSNILDKSVPFETENHISWQLDDPTATAISSTALPTIPPILADWQSFFGLNIRSRNDVFEEFFVRAQVTSANLCNEHRVCEGDFDIDGDVDGSDLAVFAADFGRTDCIE